MGYIVMKYLRINLKFFFAASFIINYGLNSNKL